MAEPISVKVTIIKRLLELVQPLLTNGKLRVIERRSAPFMQQAVKPALHLVIGDESVVGGQDGDNRGFTMEFPADFEILAGEARDPYALCDELVAYVQEKVESDAQLSGLVNIVNYSGELPFTNDATKPSGGTLLMYNIQYRRTRGNPALSY